MSPGKAAAMMGRKGGLARSERKTEAARRNGRRGGRPKGYKLEGEKDRQETGRYFRL